MSTIEAGQGHGRRHSSNRALTQSSSSRGTSSPSRISTPHASMASPGCIPRASVAQQRRHYPLLLHHRAGGRRGLLPAGLRELFAQRKSITTFGLYSPGQAVTMKRMGIEGIYLGGVGHLGQRLHQRAPRTALGQHFPSARSRTKPPVWSVTAPDLAHRNQQYLRLRMIWSSVHTSTPADAKPAGPSSLSWWHTWACGQPAHARETGPKRFVEAGVPWTPTSRTSVPAPGKRGHAGWQCPGAVGRADQAAQHRPVPARHHAGARHHRRAHRR